MHGLVKMYVMPLPVDDILYKLAPCADPEGGGGDRGPPPGKSQNYRVS